MAVKQEQTTIWWAYWLMWVLATAVGWIVGMSLLWILGFVIDPFTQNISKVIAWGVVGAVVGVVFGINDWFLFRLLGEQLPGRWAHWWVLATITGWGICIAVIVGLGAGEDLGFAVTGAVFGIGTGIPQWFVLRPHVERAEWWGLASTVAWIAGLAAIDVFDQAIGFSLAGVISGSISGAMMIWLLNHPLQKMKNSPRTGHKISQDGE